jgi:glycosyltransferase involved in cell wall biosynthesis
MAGNTPVQYHPNPGDLSFSGADNANSPVELVSGFNVVFTGNLGTVQALDTVLQAAVLLREERDICFVLVGSGSRFAWLESEIVRLGLENVRLTGRFPPAAMPAIMARASALLVSLVRSPIMSQTVPSKVQAYLAAGKPVIAALDGEGARIVDEAGAGVTCPAEDAEALADAVRRLRDMPEERRNQMGKNAARFYENNFEPRKLAKQLLDLLMETKRRQG